MNRSRAKRGIADSLMRDRRGAVAFEMLFVYGFMILTLLLPLADLARFGFQFVSAWGALRSFGEYLQYNPPPDATSTTTWASGLQKSVAGFTISNVQVLCGNTTNAVCDSSNVLMSPVKFYSYTTTVTLDPMELGSVLCGGTKKSCSFTLPYSERFQ